MIYLGIDPGMDGAIVGLTDRGIFLREPMPTLAAGTGGKRVLDTKGVLAIISRLRGLVETGREIIVALEEPSVRPKEGASRSLAAGRNHGRIEGVLVTLSVRYDVVRPQVWRKTLGLGGEGDPKEKAIAFCDRFFPELVLLRTPKCTKPHDGIADAACLAEYARRVLAGVAVVA